jgi:hypothetical protein
MAYRNPHEDATLSAENWCSVLNLSKKWGMTALSKHCIAKLASLPSDMPITSKILLARENLSVSWLVEAYNELAQRTETLTEEEISAIGLQSGNRILRLREMWFVDMEKLRPEALKISYRPSNRKSHDFRKAIRTVFCDEIEDLSR